MDMMKYFSGTFFLKKFQWKRQLWQNVKQQTCVLFNVMESLRNFFKTNMCEIFQWIVWFEISQSFYKKPIILNK